MLPQKRDKVIIHLPIFVMPRYRHSQFADFNCFFITTSIFGKEHLLLEDEVCKIILKNFTFYNEKYKAKLLAYVLMSNHVHFVIWFEKEEKKESPISVYMRDFKKYVATQIINYLKENNSKLLHKFVSIQKGQKYQIWEENFDGVHLYTRKVCEEKIDYIHNNPVKAELVKYPEDYKYSSAKFYSSDKVLKSSLVDYREYF
ncbi:transposase (plasmid) [Bernardetia sp. Wsw4-3y2]|uniref:REP-associated tyrosine transposase n=1 Tax=Bernardetia sp. Wsw4-3y2 TaxID=3127471 RepID=UPI0030CEDAE2